MWTGIVGCIDTGCLKNDMLYTYGSLRTYILWLWSRFDMINHMDCCSFCQLLQNHAVRWKCERICILFASSCSQQRSLFHFQFCRNCLCKTHRHTEEREQIVAQNFHKIEDRWIHSESICFVYKTSYNFWCSWHIRKVLRMFMLAKSSICFMPRLNKFCISSQHSLHW